MLAAIQALAPDGFALRQEMLAGVPPEQRATSGAAQVASGAAQVVIAVTTTNPSLLGVATTVPLAPRKAGDAAKSATPGEQGEVDTPRDAPPPTPQPPAARPRRHLLLAAGIMLALGLCAVLAYLWMR